MQYKLVSDKYKDEGYDKCLEFANEDLKRVKDAMKAKKKANPNINYKIYKVIEKLIAQL